MPRPVRRAGLLARIPSSGADHAPRFVPFFCTTGSISRWTGAGVALGVAGPAGCGRCCFVELAPAGGWSLGSAAVRGHFFLVVRCWFGMAFLAAPRSRAAAVGRFAMAPGDRPAGQAGTSTGGSPLGAAGSPESTLGLPGWPRWTQHLVVA